jgi:hypothetical protein
MSAARRTRAHRRPLVTLLTRCRRPFLWPQLRNTLEAEMRLQAELAQLLGAMDVLLAGVAHAAQERPPPKKVPRLAASSAARDGAAAAAPTATAK